MAQKEVFYIIDIPYLEMFQIMLKELADLDMVEKTYKDYKLELKKCSEVRILNPVNSEDELVKSTTINTGYILQVIPVAKLIREVEDAIVFYFDASHNMVKRMSFYKDPCKTNLTIKYNNRGSAESCMIDKEAYIIPKSIQMVQISPVGVYIV